MTTAQRFWAKVQKGAGCWLWTACTDGRGYGTIREGGVGSPMIKAHRFSWCFHFGSVPDGLCVLHKCDVRACVNPAHLFLGTVGDNNRDCVAKGRENPWNRGITHCKRGHEFSSENTRFQQDGRRCRVCIRVRSRERQRRERRRRRDEAAA